MERVESQEKWVETGEKFFMTHCLHPIVPTIYPLFREADNGKTNLVLNCNSLIIKQLHSQFRGLFHQTSKLKST